MRHSTDSDGAQFLTEDKSKADKFSADTDFLHGDGVIPAIDKNTRQFLESNLKVVPAAVPDMTVGILDGIALIDGMRSGNRELDGKVKATLVVSPADTVNPRLDIVVITAESDSISGKKVKSTKFEALLLPGVPSAAPVAPSVPISHVLLATVSVAANATAITAVDISDDRKFLSCIDDVEDKQERGDKTLQEQIDVLKDQVQTLQNNSSGSVMPKRVIHKLASGDATLTGLQAFQPGCFQLSGTFGKAPLFNTLFNTPGVLPTSWSFTSGPLVVDTNGSLCLFQPSTISSNGIATSVSQSTVIGDTDLELSLVMNFATAGGSTANNSLQLELLDQLTGDVVTRFGASFLSNTVTPKPGTNGIFAVLPFSAGQAPTVLRVPFTAEFVANQDIRLTLSLNKINSSATLSIMSVDGLTTFSSVSGLFDPAAYVTLTKWGVRASIQGKKMLGSTCIKEIDVQLPNAQLFNTSGTFLTNILPSTDPIVTVGLIGEGSSAPTNTSILVEVSDDGGTTFVPIPGGLNSAIDLPGTGNQLVFKVTLSTTDTTRSPFFCSDSAVTDNSADQAEVIILKAKVNELLTATTGGTALAGTVVPTIP